MVFLSQRDGGHYGVLSRRCHTGAFSCDAAHKRAIVAQEVMSLNSAPLGVHESTHAALDNKGREPAVAGRRTALCYSDATLRYGDPRTKKDFFTSSIPTYNICLLFMGCVNLYTIPLAG